ncbi:MAG: AraC family transcriptional regulator [Erysipelotrichaceae bacterium]|nr:AraC family transcriptional regulator [Erysipelotrichaceae bacterium]MDY5251920.1 AraC family transcriptional regulator [Erysipelotrichaceae bacterium]
MKNINKTLFPDVVSKMLMQFEITPISFFLYQNKSSQSTFITAIYTYRLAIVTKGIYQVETKEDRFKIKAGDIILIPPFNSYNIYCLSQQAACYILNFNLRYFIKDNYHHMIEQKIIAKFENALTKDMYDFLDRAHHMQTNNDYGHYYMIKIAIEQLLILCDSSYLTNNSVEQSIDNNYSNRSQECVIEALRYIDAHLKESVRVADICNYLNVSQSYLYTCFQKVMKCSISHAIVEYKLNRSVELLQNRDLRIVDIAQSVGFENIYHFSNTFKKHFGISPTNFRQQFI